MKANEKKELYSKSMTELRKLLKDAVAALEALRLDKEQNKLKNTRSLFLKRKEIAVLKTIMTAKEGMAKVATS